jgi:hypothetical protein
LLFPVLGSEWESTMLTAVGPANLPFRLVDALGDVDAEEMDEREEEEVLLLEE